MGKSIYEVALKKLTLIQNRLSTDYGKFLEVKLALKQAHQQEKLLELYRELFKCKLWVVHDSESINNYHQIKKQIEELENE